MTAKRFPWISLTLLFVAYAALGWEVTDPHFPRLEGVVRRCESSLARSQVRSPIPHLLKSLPATEAPALQPTAKEAEPGEAAAHKTPTETSERGETPTIKVPSEASKATEQLPTNRPELEADSRSQEFQLKNLQNTHFRPTDLESFLCLLSVKYNLPIILSAVVWIVIAAIAFMNPLINFSRFITRWFQSDTVAFLAICTIAGMASMMLFWLHVFLQILTILAAETLSRLDLQLSRLSSTEAFWILLLVSLAGLTSGLTLRFIVSY